MPRSLSDFIHPRRALPQRLSGFARDQSGGVTVDWVILVAASLSLALILVSSVGQATQGASNDVKRCLRIQKNLSKRDDLSYKVKLKRMKNRCGRI